jgi:hypothetical protein
VLWHPGSKYEQVLSGLDKQTASHAKSGYSPPSDVAALLVRFEKEGVLKAREKAAEQARGDVSDPAAARAAKTGAPEPAGAS